MTFTGCAQEWIIVFERISWENNSKSLTHKDSHWSLYWCNNVTCIKVHWKIHTISIRLTQTVTLKTQPTLEFGICSHLLWKLVELVLNNKCCWKTNMPYVLPLFMKYKGYRAVKLCGEWTSTDPHCEFLHHQRTSNKLLSPALLLSLTLTLSCLISQATCPLPTAVIVQWHIDAKEHNDWCSK